jgi:hypothetical protein
VRQSPLHSSVPIQIIGKMDSTYATARPVLPQLEKAEEECRKLLDELTGFDKPEPFADLSAQQITRLAEHFKGRASEAENLKIQILTILPEGHSSYQHVDRLIFTEEYCIDRGFPHWNKRPSRSAIETALRVLEKVKKQGHTRSDSQGKERRRGPLPKTDDHKRVAKIVGDSGDSWKRDAITLEDLCRKLDEARVEKPKQWKEWPKKPRSWVHASSLRPKLVRQAIEYRLKQAANAD